MKSIISQLQVLAAHSPFVAEEVESVIRKVQGVHRNFLPFGQLANDLGIPSQWLDVLSVEGWFPKPVIIDGVQCWEKYAVDAHLAWLYACVDSNPEFAEWKRRGILDGGLGCVEFLNREYAK